jgi:hypothetical protein
MLALGAKAVALHIGGRVRAVRNIVGRQVGELCELAIELRLELFGAPLQVGNAVLEPRDLGHQRLRGRFILLGLGLTDFLGGGVAPRLRLLEPGDRGAAALVKGEEIVDEDLTVGLRHPTAPEPARERLGVLADPFDVVHFQEARKRTSDFESS